MLKTLFCMFLGALIYAVPSSGVLARWAHPSDAAIKSQTLSSIEVNLDGTYTKICEKQVGLLQEIAKQVFAHFPIEYNASTHQLDIIKAYTEVQGTQYPLHPEHIEDKPLANNVAGFDQHHKLILAYPHLAQGAKVFIKYKVTNKKPAIPNLYASYFEFGKMQYSLGETLSIRSRLPLYLKVNDPEKVLSLQQSTQRIKNKTWYVLDIRQVKPYLKDVINENASPLLNPRHRAWVAICSVNNWKDFGQALAQEYEAIQNEPLPDLYKEIAKAASLQKSTLDKINTVTSQLSQKLNVLAHTQTLNGRFIPQPLQQVAKTHLGDSKDFSMAAHVIFQSLKIPSKIAFVKRGEGLFDSPDFFNPEQFTHAIVKVILPKGALWIDSTRFTSMASYPYPDISDRQALVLDTKGSTYETIPPLNPAHHQLVKKEIWDLKACHHLDVKGQLTYIGTQARFFSGIENQLSKASIEHLVLNELGDNYGHILNYKVKLPPLQSKIVRDHTFEYTLSSEQAGLKTSAGLALPLSFDATKAFIAKKDTVSDIYLGSPYTLEEHITLKHIKPQGQAPLNCHLDSPWVRLSRNVTYQANQIIIHQKMELKKSWINSEELTSKAYTTLKEYISQNFNPGMAIIFTPTPLLGAK